MNKIYSEVYIVIITSQLPNRFHGPMSPWNIIYDINNNNNNAVHPVEWIVLGSESNSNSNNRGVGEEGDKNSMEFWNEITLYTIFVFLFDCIRNVRLSVCLSVRRAIHRIRRPYVVVVRICTFNFIQHFSMFALVLLGSIVRLLFQFNWKWVNERLGACVCEREKGRGTEQLCMHVRGVQQ